jgi:uncharacterized repeat protein (TIGR02543 family)
MKTKVIFKNAISVLLCFALVVTLTPLGFSPVKANAATETVDTVEKLQEALDKSNVTDITLSDDFYADTDARTTPITIGGIHTQAATIIGKSDKAITAAGLHVLTGNVTLKNVNVKIASMTRVNVPLRVWTEASSYGAVILINRVENVTLDNCDIVGTNAATTGPNFTAGVLSSGVSSSGLTVKDCTVSAMGRGGSAAQGLMITSLSNNTTVTNNTLSGDHATAVGSTGYGPYGAPTSALFIQTPAVHPKVFNFSGNTFQGGETTGTKSYSFYVNKLNNDRKTDPEMVADNFAFYSSAGIRPWIMDERNTGDFYKLISSLVKQSGSSGYGQVVNYVHIASGDAVTEGYVIDNGKVVSIDFWGYPIVSDAYAEYDKSVPNDLRGRVNAHGIKDGEFHWSRQVTAAATANINFDSQNPYTTLTYSAKQIGGVSGSAVSDILITFSTNLDAATATAIEAYITSASTPGKSIKLSDDGDKSEGAAKTWLIDMKGDEFANGEKVTVDLFGINDYPITTGVMSVEVYKIVVSEDGSAKIDVTDKEANNAVNKALNKDKNAARIEIKVPSVSGGNVTSIAVSLPTTNIAVYSKGSNVEALLVKTEVGEFEIGRAALSSIAAVIASEPQSSSVTLSITKETEEKIPAQNKTDMAGSSVFDISIKVGEKKVEKLGSNIYISLPYKLKEGETASNIKVYYLPESGEPQKIASTTYSSLTKKISFSTDHLSLWAVKAEDISSPKLSTGKVTRANATSAKIDFSTNEAGTVYYLALKSGSAAPSNLAVVFDGVNLGKVDAGNVTNKTINLSSGAKDIYIVVRDGEGNVSDPLIIAASTVEIQFSANGGKKVSPSTKTVKGWDSIKLPKSTRSHYTLVGWFDGEKNVGKAGKTYVATKSVTLKAKWTLVKRSIKLNANGGVISKKKVKTVKKKYGSKLGKLTKPTRKGYAFKGWYTKKKGGKKVSAKKRVLKNATYYAQWKRKAKSSKSTTSTKSYTVQVRNGQKVIVIRLD